MWFTLRFCQMVLVWAVLSLKKGIQLCCIQAWQSCFMRNAQSSNSPSSTVQHKQDHQGSSPSTSRLIAQKRLLVFHSLPFFFPRLRDLGAQILSVQSFLRVISKIYLYQKSKYSLVQIFLMSMRVSFFKKIICLSALGLSCSKQDL